MTRMKRRCFTTTSRTRQDFCGPAAAAEGPGREELFVEHLHAFSPASLALAAARAGLCPLRLERITEPSGKHTIFAFLTTGGGRAPRG